MAVLLTVTTMEIQLNRILEAIITTNKETPVSFTVAFEHLNPYFYLVAILPFTLFLSSHYLIPPYSSPYSQSPISLGAALRSLFCALCRCLAL